MSYRNPITYKRRGCAACRRGVTLVELLLVVAIISIVSSLGLMLLRGAEEDALKSRTQSQIERLNRVLAPKLEAYFTRILPERLPAHATLENIREFRNRALQEFMRVELPSAYQHVKGNYPVNTGNFPLGNPPGTPYAWNNLPRPQMLDRYRSYFSSKGGWDDIHADAECLYAILLLNYGEDGQSLLHILRDSEFTESDDDQDHYPEVIDAFGTPLRFAIVDSAGDPITPDASTPVPLEDLKIQIVSDNLAGKLR